MICSAKLSLIVLINTSNDKLINASLYLGINSCLTSSFYTLPMLSFVVFFTNILRPQQSVKFVFPIVLYTVAADAMQVPIGNLLLLRSFTLHYIR